MLIRLGIAGGIIFYEGWPTKGLGKQHYFFKKLNIQSKIRYNP
jgi:hypothetical protein